MQSAAHLLQIHVKLKKTKERIQVPAYLLTEAFNQIFSVSLITSILFPVFLYIFSTTIADSFSFFVFHYSYIEEEFAALPLINGPQSRSLHAERIPLLKMTVIFQIRFLFDKVWSPKKTVNRFKNTLFQNPL